MRLLILNDLIKRPIIRQTYKFDEEERRNIDLI